MAEEIIRGYFGDAARYLSKESCARIAERCSALGALPETWCRYWRETQPAGYIYPNAAVTEAALDRYGDWVAEQREYIPILTALEIAAFKAEAGRSRDPASFLKGDIPDVSPLVRYAMGRYLGYEEEAAPWLKKAEAQLRELPWYWDSLEKLQRYLPERRSDVPEF